jgi:cysteine desulfuration protein SufE
MDMTITFQKKSDEIKKFFNSITTSEQRYEALIEMGRQLPPLRADLKIPENLVAGCQSQLYLVSRFSDGRVYFDAASDALISAGLAALLIQIYNGETPETILKEPPRYLSDLGIYASLSPNRSHGLSQIHLKMKQHALNFLMEETRS